MKLTNTNDMTVERSGALGSRGVAISIIGFWLFFVVLSTLRSLLLNSWTEQPRLFGLRLLVAAGSILITFALHAGLHKLDQLALGRRITAAALMSGVAALAFAVLNAAIYLDVPPCRQSLPQASAPGLGVVSAPMCGETLGMLVAEHSVTGYFLMAAWSALYLALGYAAEVGAWERRAASLRSAAQLSELRALRYQVNPHFLFNALNALSSLVLAGQNDTAEEMIAQLSTFYRASLAFDPDGDVCLSEEVDLQRLYLSIEQQRFPQRLRTAFDIPDDLLSAQLPGMVLQPLVENAIKHGVARARGLTTVRIAARREAGRLVLDVADDARRSEGKPPSLGSGIGLRNVADRLAARYGDDAACRWSLGEPCGFAVRLDLPLAFAHD